MWRLRGSDVCRGNIDLVEHTQRRWESCQGERVGLIAFTSLMQWAWVVVVFFVLNLEAAGAGLKIYILCHLIDDTMWCLIIWTDFPNKKRDPLYFSSNTCVSLCHKSMPSQVFTVSLFFQWFVTSRNGQLFCSYMFPAILKGWLSVVMKVEIQVWGQYSVSGPCLPVHQCRGSVFHLVSGFKVRKPPLVTILWVFSCSQIWKIVNLKVVWSTKSL